jgi:hypothetical protein
MAKKAKREPIDCKKPGPRPGSKCDTLTPLQGDTSTRLWGHELFAGPVPKVQGKKAKVKPKAKRKAK